MHNNLKIQWYSFILILFALHSCNKNPPQYPTEYSNEGFMEYSMKYNRQLKDLENQMIQSYIQSHKEDFLQTNAGFYMTRTKLNTRTVKNNDTIIFNYRISNLQDSVIYDYDSIGSQHIVLGQSSIMPGLEYGLKRMSEGESATLLIPSSLGYGVDGDRKNIGADQPLVIDIKLNKIVNYEN